MIDSHRLPERGRLTDYLVNQLRKAFEADAANSNDPILVGDGQIPDKAGWPKGQPDVGTFVASVTLSTDVATPLDRDTLQGRHRSWQMSYGLRSLGGARAQADATADLARPVLADALRGVTLDLGVPWKVTDVFYPQLAPVRPIAGSDPVTWEVSDQLVVYLERSRTAT